MSILDPGEKHWPSTIGAPRNWRLETQTDPMRPDKILVTVVDKETAETVNITGAHEVVERFLVRYLDAINGHAQIEHKLRGLLTRDERKAVEKLGEVAGLIKEICHVPQTDQTSNPAADDDWREAADKIHQLQNTILAQAAARAFPYKYRRLGEQPKRTPVDESLDDPAAWLAKLGAAGYVPIADNDE